MDIEQIRRQHINYWADRLTRSVLAEKTGYKDTIYINQLCSGHGSFGSRTARKIEKALGLKHGTFDTPFSDTNKSSEQNTSEAPLLTPEQAVLWNEDQLDDAAEVKARHDGKEVMRRANLSLTTESGSQSFLLSYDGPTMPQFGIPHTPITLLVNPEEKSAYPSSIWLINGHVRIGLYQKFDDDTHILDFKNKDLGTKKLDLTTDKFIGWQAGIIYS